MTKAALAVLDKLLTEQDRRMSRFHSGEYYDGYEDAIKEARDEIAKLPNE